MKHTDIKDIFASHASYVGKNTVVCGWVRTSRNSKNVAFVELNDGTCVKNLQVVIDKEKFDSKVENAFSVGTAVKMEGVIVESAGNVCELALSNYTILGESPVDYPLQKKRHSLEFLRTMPHLRVRTNTFLNVQRVRSALAYATHTYFQQNGFAYINA
ncbi:MAG: asparagine--tRNA ligase, partial [Clostridia bacterium]|nr:asparagine--tRNA ligase [Clostridia bacterium]